MPERPVARPGDITHTIYMTYEFKYNDLIKVASEDVPQGSIYWLRLLCEDARVIAIVTEVPLNPGVPMYINTDDIRRHIERLLSTDLLDLTFTGSCRAVIQSQRLRALSLRVRSRSASVDWRHHSVFSSLTYQRIWSCAERLWSSATQPLSMREGKSSRRYQWPIFRRPIILIDVHIGTDLMSWQMKKTGQFSMKWGADSSTRLLLMTLMLVGGIRLLIGQLSQMRAFG